MHKLQGTGIEPVSRDGAPSSIQLSYPCTQVWGGRMYLAGPNALFISEAPQTQWTRRESNPGLQYRHRAAFGVFV